MGLSKVEVKLRRLLEAAPRQQNQAKLVHYITTARGLLEQLGAESTPEELSSVSEAKPSGYSELIEALAATLSATRAYLEVVPISHDRKQRDFGTPIKLDTEAHIRIEKQRELQDGLTDEMAELAHQLKESSLIMNQSVQETEKILVSTARAMEHSLASSSSATVRASEVYLLDSRTSCFQWLLILMMTCMFVMVVLLIRVT